MNENKIIETLKYISQFVEKRHDEGLGDYLHIVIGRTDINVIDETIYLLERKQKEIVRYKKEIKKLQEEIEEKTTIIMAGAEKVKQLEKEIILLKIEKLKALKQYKECHLSQIPDTANIYYSIKLELEAIDEEISNLMKIWENY